MKSHAIKQMPFALARDDGLAIKFQFLTHSNRTFDFECPPEAIPVILARMMSALEQAAKIKSVKPTTEAIETIRCETGSHVAGGKVILTLYPSANAGVSFALSPEIADRASSGLAAESARLRPVDPQSLS